MEVLWKRYGQRFAEVDLAKFVREKTKVDNTVELLVLRSNEMDNDFENNPEAAPGPHDVTYLFDDFIRMISPERDSTVAAS